MQPFPLGERMERPSELVARVGHEKRPPPFQERGRVGRGGAVGLVGGLAAGHRPRVFDYRLPVGAGSFR